MARLTGAEPGDENAFVNVRSYTACGKRERDKGVLTLWRRGSVS